MCSQQYEIYLLHLVVLNGGMTFDGHHIASFNFMRNMLQEMQRCNMYFTLFIAKLSSK